MTLTEFFVIVPDRSTVKHAEVRPRRLAYAREKLAAGEFYRMSGAYFSEEGEYAGTAMMVVAESEEDVRAQILNDPYAKEGVWDVEKARVFHFKTGDAMAINYPTGK